MSGVRCQGPAPGIHLKPDPGIWHLGPVASARVVFQVRWSLAGRLTFMMLHFTIGLAGGGRCDARQSRHLSLAAAQPLRRQRGTRAAVSAATWPRPH